ncbi:stress-sensitive restriction system protein 1 [Corynebacterium suranareeae]|uniref:Stress-sensitive restriction system protein 1 n=1 Tax=Corynebacterium suranareeae TaxID=2506452 RepID=A0A160PSK0_9CORY|nr:restriction endonuclease PLD domain-containing protein [Corynebacterium suranareeae]BAU96133.1 stress-sensitive restriction system protein 1 [Corynebacterium suranareeae]
MKPTVNVVFNAHRPNDTQPLDKFFDKELKDTHHLDITVGYISEKSLRYLRDILEEKTNITANLTCGMHACEGMTAPQLHYARELHTFLSNNNRGGVFVLPRLRYHGKIYLFHQRTAPDPKAYIGSANLSAIIPGHASTFETGVMLDPAPTELIQHLQRDVEPLKVPIDEYHVPIVADQNALMRGVSRAAPMSTSHVVAVMSSPAQYTFDLPLKAHPKSSLNAHLGGDGGRMQKTGRRLSRKWYEGELIVDEKYRDLPGYPQKGVPFTVITDDGWTFECKTSGDGGKNLRSVGSLETFGAWMKSRLIDAGALEFGETATEKNIERFGRSHLTMKYHPDYNVWSFDLSTITPIHHTEQD